MGRYARLARLAYVVLPGTVDQHRRVLLAHAAVQRALTARHQDDGDYPVLRRAVLAHVLRRRRGRPLLPQVWGLKLFTVPGPGEDLLLGRDLAVLDPYTRAGYALFALEELTADSVLAELAALGCAAPAVTVAGAVAFAATHPVDPLLTTGFDPSTVHARTTDLLRRRGRAGVWVAGALALCVGAVSTALGNLPADGPSAAGRDAAPAASVVTVDAGAWRHTERIDFTAWPARGPAVSDGALVRRALTAWTDRDPVVAAERPQLLWAGPVDGDAVVLLYDGRTVARYTLAAHPVRGSSGARLDLSRADGSDVTTAGAVVLHAGADGDRFLLAPWVQSVAVRDLAHPDTPARMLPAPAGLTPPVARPDSGHCGAAGAEWPVLQLRSSSVIAEHHAFLLTDLGDVVPAHLSYLPPPSQGAARSPREATGGPALVAWGRLTCALGNLATRGVRSVNAWEFAQQQLPDQSGQASWVCLRADRWSGGGTAATLFLPPAAAPDAPARITATERQGRACGRFSQVAVAAAVWNSRTGHRYLLLAGSRRVVRFRTGTSSVAAPGHTTAVPWARPDSRPVPPVRGVLDSGGVVSPLG